MTASSFSASPSKRLRCGRYDLDLSTPKVMGIVNVTPDSFSDGGRHASLDSGIAHARALVAEGADMLDIGGESTRPGAASVPADVEIDRVVPLVAALLELDVPLSVDTTKPEVMRAALAAGADMINDINAFRTDGALDAVRQSQCGLCVMHMQGEPRTMQDAPRYQDVVAEVAGFLAARARELVGHGVDESRITLDPGFGFGKTVDQNYQLMAGLAALTTSGFPVLIGLSRKSMLGAITGKPVGDRVAASVAGALAAVARGAGIVRVHDVSATVDALKVWGAVARAAAR